MKKMKYLRVLGLLPALSLLSIIPARATEVSANVDSNMAEAKGDTTKAALDELDIEIDRVDAQIDNAPTPEEKAAAKARMDVLKDRRSDLRKTYVKARYDQLIADVRAESDHVGNWSKNTYHHHATAAASMDIAAYKMQPTDTNKDDAKAALKAVGKRISQLEDRVDNMPKGPERDAENARIKVLKDRRDQLKHEFNKARLDSLIDDVQSEWGKLTS